MKRSYREWHPCIKWLLLSIAVIIGIIICLLSAPSISYKHTLLSIHQLVAPTISISAAHDSNKIEPYHDPEPFCNLSVDPYHNHSNIVYHNQFPDSVTIEQLIAKRSEPIENIPICPNADIQNYNQYTEILSKLPNNLLSYTNRCQINAIGRGKRQFGGLLSGDPLFPDMSTQIGFLHVYKAGGTTVRDTMNNIMPGLSRTIWHNYKGNIREFMSHLFMFSHVRDPVTRTLSSYFELHRRNETDAVRNNMIGIDSFRYLLSMMGNRMDCALGNKNKLHKMRDNTIGSIYFNMHIMPQMYFLTEAANPWSGWPLNYVGNMSEITQSMFEIFYYFFWNTTDFMRWRNVSQTLSRDEAQQVFTESYHHGRNRHYKKYINGGERKAQTKGSDILKYQVEVDDLSDDDIRNICEIYWMDYICIPFRVPQACNLTHLFVKHYGDDVVYRDCWDYNTKAWKSEFTKKYIDENSKKKRLKTRAEQIHMKQMRIMQMKQMQKKLKRAHKHKH